MIFAIEGNINLGKTTFINEFIKNHNNFLKVDEIPIKLNLSHYDRQIYYIDMEKNKTKYLKVNKNLFLDRTILSTLAYTLHGKYLNKEEQSKIIKIIIHNIKFKNFIEPDKIFYVTTFNNEEIKKNHKKLKAKKHTMDILASDDFLQFFDDLFFHWLQSCKLEQNIFFNNKNILVYNTKNLFKRIAIDLENYI